MLPRHRPVSSALTLALLLLCVGGCKRDTPLTRLQNAREKLYAHLPQAALEEYRLSGQATEDPVIAYRFKALTAG